MNKRFAFLLSISTSIVYQSVLICSPVKADTTPPPSEDRLANQNISNNSLVSSAQAGCTSAQQKRIEVAALVPVMPTLGAPLHPISTTSVSQPALLYAPEEKNNLNNAVPKAPSMSAPGARIKDAVGMPPAGPRPTGNNKTSRKTTRVTKGSNKNLIASVHAMRNVEDEIKNVSLTFDDGPSPVYTPKVLAILKKEGIHATFCLIGREAKKHPELVQQIVAEGHIVADHSMNHDEHLNLRSDKKFKSEIINTKDLIESIVPGTTVYYYRAPAGNISRHQKKLLKKWGMKSLAWSVDTKDWQRPGVDEILATVKRQLHPGGVILMHDSGGNRSETIDALEKVIPELKKEGYQFVFPG